MKLRLNQKEANVLDILIRDVGRAAHVLRNYTTGYTTIEHPELHTLDHFSQKIEGLTKVIRTNIKYKRNINQPFLKVKRSSAFLLRTFKTNFANSEKLSKEMIKNIIEFLIAMQEKTELSDFIITRAMLNETENQYLIDKLKPVKPTAAISQKLSKEFEVDGYIKSLKGLSTIKNDIKDVLTVRTFMLIGNKAHQIQDEVSSYHDNNNVTKQSNDIVNKAGAIEEYARGNIKWIRDNGGSAGNESFKDQYAEIMKILKEIQAITDSNDFLIKEEIKHLGDDIDRVEALLKCLLKIRAN